MENCRRFFGKEISRDYIWPSTRRRSPGFEALEDSALLSKEKLAGDIMPDFATGQGGIGGETDASLRVDEGTTAALALSTMERFAGRDSAIELGAEAASLLVRLAANQQADLKR